MSLINVSNLTFAYEGSYDNIFEDVSFQIDTDWRLGFTGRNGRGKTTFLKLLLGEYPYKGSIAASVRFEYFPYDVPDMTRDAIDVAYGLHPELELWQLYKELSLLQVEEDVLYRPYETLSNGERTKLLLAVLFLKQNEFLLIDEPTNHLDMEGRDIVSAYLRTKKGFILVSHDRYFLDQCVDHILSINKANIEIQRGDFTSWQRNKAYADQHELDENARLEKDVKRLKDVARRTADWSDAVERTKIGTHPADRGAIGHKAAKMMKRSKAVEQRRERAVEEKSALLKNIERNERVSIRPLAHHAKRLVELSNLSINYGDKLVCSGIDLLVQQGERIALRGKNGSGKSSIIKLIAGEGIPYSGVCNLASQLVVSYVPQDPSFLCGDIHDFTQESGIDESLFMTILRKLDFERVQFEKDLSNLSAGQKKKILIARSLCQQAHLYLWDEPLNYIDVLSRMQIERLILEGEPTMLFVEHDRYFSDAVSTRNVQL